MADNNQVQVGDQVSWKWGSGNPGGEVAEIKEHGKLSIQSDKGNTISRKADPEDPAIHISRDGNDVVKRAHEVTVEEKANGTKGDQSNGDAGNADKEQVNGKAEEKKDSVPETEKTEEHKKQPNGSGNENQKVVAQETETPKETGDTEMKEAPQETNVEKSTGEEPPEKQKTAEEKAPAEKPDEQKSTEQNEESSKANGVTESAEAPKKESSKDEPQTPAKKVDEKPAEPKTGTKRKAEKDEPIETNGVNDTENDDPPAAKKQKTIQAGGDSKPKGKPGRPKKAPGEKKGYVRKRAPKQPATADGQPRRSARNRG